MAVERTDVPQGEPVPENFNGFALEHVTCEHGTPFVLLQVWKEGEMIAARRCDPEELMTSAQGFVDAAAACETARAVKAFKEAGKRPIWQPSGPGDEAGFGPWPRGPHNN